MRQLTIAAGIFLAVCGPTQAGADPFAAHMDTYLATWSHDITLATVARLYARQVNYYGHPMSVSSVYRDKRAFIQRWPVRRYAAVPGTVSNDCQHISFRCRISAVMRWSRTDRTGSRQSGTNSVGLELAREDGALKIVGESGSAVTRR